MAPVDSFKGSLGGVSVKLSTFGGFFRWFAQGLAVEREAVCGVHEDEHEEALNTSVRKFLKKLGVTAQREIEMAVRDADAKGQLKGSDSLPAKAVVTVGGIEAHTVG